MLLLLFSSQSCLTLCDLMDCTTRGLSVSISQSLPKFMSLASVVPSSHLILWHPLLLPSIFPSIRVFSNELAVFIRWPKYWSFSIIPSNKCSGLIPLKIDWFVLLAAQGTLRSLLQHHSLKASILQHPAFFIIQLSQVRDHWKDHSLDYTDLCWQCLCFSIQICHHFPAKNQFSSAFMATVTVHSDSGAQEKEICHYFHLFPLLFAMQ